MARNITIIYGLLSVACKYEPAVQKTESMINLCCGQTTGNDHAPEPLTMPKTCVTCGPIKDFNLIKKGIREGDTIKIVTQQDVADAKRATADQFKGKLELVPYHAADILTATAQGTSLQYVTPAKGNEDHYQLLVKMVAEHPEMAFVGQYTPVSKVGMYRLGVRDGVLVMEERTREQALKPVPEVSGDLNEPLYQMLEATLQVQDYDPATFEDTYALEVARLAIEAEDSVNLKTGTADTSKTVKVTDADLMAKLQELAASKG